MRDKKRYVVQIDTYIDAENDYMAKKIADKIANSIKRGYNAKVTEIGEQPFASFSYRKLDNPTYYGDLEKETKVKEKPLPF